MSTSDPDLEARLAALGSPPPRPGLRAQVLAAVGAELASARPPLLDRLLARRATWAAAAAVLVALLIACAWTDRVRAARLDRLASRPGEAARPDLRAWREREALLARLLGEGGPRD